MHLCTFKKKKHIGACGFHIPSYAMLKKRGKNNHLDSSGCRFMSSIPTPSRNMQSSATRRRLARGGFLMFFFQNWYAFWPCFGWLWIYPLVIKHGWKIHEIRDHCHVGALSTPTTNIKHWGSSSQIWLQMNNTWNHSPDLVHYIQRLNQYVLGIFRLNRYPCV